MNRVLCLLALTFAAFSAARADEEKIPLDKLPKAVRAAVVKRFPKAELVGAEKETENGKTVYEVNIMVDGRVVDVTLTPDGVITTIEKELPVKELPKSVSAAVTGKYPQGVVQSAEEVVEVKDGKESLAYYEVVVTAGTKKFEVQVTADGKIKKTEEKDGKDEKK